MNTKTIMLAALLALITYTIPAHATVTVTVTTSPRIPFIYHSHLAAPYYPVYPSYYGPSYYGPFWYDYYGHPDYEPTTFLQACATAGILLAAYALIDTIINH